jgi:uncharacterized membrane protein YeiH
MATTDTRFFRIIDLAGTFVLAIQGASIAAVNNLDALGVIVVSLCTAMGGGIMRDVLIGEHPPEALRGWPLVTIALAGALLTFFAFHSVEQIPEYLLIVIDALGLSLLAISGAEKALEYKLTPIAAIMMGAISGAGGFTIRDILLARVPAVLRVDFLATAAIAGAAVLVAARLMGLGPNGRRCSAAPRVASYDWSRCGSTGACRPPISTNNLRTDRQQLLAPKSSIPAVRATSPRSIARGGWPQRKCWATRTGAASPSMSRPRASAR